jgi:hypothetical protein
MKSRNQKSVCSPLLNLLRFWEKISFKFIPSLGENILKFTPILRENILKFTPILGENSLKFSSILGENLTQIFLILGENHPQIFSDFQRKYTSKRFFDPFSHFQEYPPPAFTSSRRP